MFLQGSPKHIKNIYITIFSVLTEHFLQSNKLKSPTCVCFIQIFLYLYELLLNNDTPCSLQVQRNYSIYI